jgi:hypothetical protein
MVRTEITIETHEVTVIRHSGRQTTGFCHACQSFVSAYLPDEIAGALRWNDTDLQVMLETGKIHFIKTAEGVAPFICGDSIGKSKI